MAGLIKAKVPQAEVTGFVGRRSSFEVTVNETVIHSKLERGGFPEFTEVVEIVAAAEAGGSIKKVDKVQSSCTVL
ncbi:hypothetical protein Pmani_014683 [Petrolisthes manimaculis]|uniref:Selenoprotein n=1 Tax=Petrolisthes manimaculis TaxID=1843537 RepID=A0AAE1PUZ3_9EUCA|nr:hypothetical protein Pmani_014683 [Petrolisthes manimaculis]